MPKGHYNRKPKDDDAPRRFPVALESEKGALGSILSGREEFLSELEPDEFYDIGCRRAWEAARVLSEAGMTLSPVSVHERSGVDLAQLEELRAKYGESFEKEVKSFCKEVRRVAALRGVYNACKEAQDSIGKDVDLNSVLSGLEANIIGMDKDGSTEAKEGLSVFKGVQGEFVARSKAGGGVEISTGIKKLDAAIIGLRPAKMMVVAGRPGMGKTALSDTIRRAVVSQGYGVIQFSLEMDADELMERELAYRSGVDLRKIMSGSGLPDEEVDRIGSLDISGVADRWWIDDRTYSISGIRRRARILASRMSRKGIKLGLVIIDYIQLAGDNGDGREQSVAAISRGCKLMAKELGCTVMALSQLNRSCEYREDKRPLMSDLRESGSIEQDADIVAFVYREHQYDNSFPPDEAEIIIRKHRAGPTGTIHISYNPKLVCFTDKTPITWKPVPVPDEQF